MRRRAASSKAPAATKLPPRTMIVVALLEPVDGNRTLTGSSVLFVTDSASTVAGVFSPPPLVVFVSGTVGATIVLVVDCAVVVSATVDDEVALVVSGIDELDDEGTDEDDGIDEDDDGIDEAADDAGADDGVDELAGADELEWGTELDELAGADELEWATELDDDEGTDDGVAQARPAPPTATSITPPKSNVRVVRLWPVDELGVYMARLVSDGRSPV